MMISRPRNYGLLLAAFLLFLGACSTEPAKTLSPEEQEKFDVVIRIKNDPDNLNAIRHRTSTAILIKKQIYYTLTATNPTTNELVPIVAQSRAKISPDGRSFTFDIRPEATWDDGTPITGYDYLFVLKAINNPLVNAAHYRPVISAILDVVIDEQNPKHFTVVTDTIFFLGELLTGDLEMMPEHIYDSNKYMRQFSVADLKENPTEFEKNADCKAFAEVFNSEKYGNEIISGAGPYEFEEWIPNISVTLKRKENWWGDKVVSDEREFKANPDRLIYRIINDEASDEAALAKGEVDVSYSIPSSQFAKLQKNQAIADQYTYHSPETYTYGYIGLNNRPPAGRKKYFVDKRVRRAMAHLLDMDQVIEDVLLGYARRTVGPVMPMRGPMEYNTNLTPPEFDMDKAKALFDEAGWKDSNGDGIRDKIIDGRKVEFKPEILLAPNREASEKIVLLLQKNCEKAGIKLNINVQDIKVQRDMYINHNFDMYISGFVKFPIPTDLKQIWHSEAWYNKGTNFFGFGTPEADSLIDEIRVTLSAEKRKPMYYRIQQIIYDEQPVIFTYVPTEKIVINKRFETPITDAFRPGFHPNEWKLAKK